jgi:hypothetical protein
MGLSPADWRRPIDAAYRFQLRHVDEVAPAVPAMGASRDIRDVASEALVDGDGARFDARVSRWSGPDDVDADGAQPYAGEQLRFEEQPWCSRLSLADHDAVLRGAVRVMRDSGRVDYVLRDHHMVDVALYHYRTTGDLPAAMFHADRHSDWCTDGFLNARRPPQAATWWALLEGLKRPDGRAVLGEGEVTFTTAQPDDHGSLSDGVGRDVGASTRVPWWVARGALGWPDALGSMGGAAADWVSLDLDYFQPRAQLALTSGLLRDPRYQQMMRQAKVRVFVLSPQFANGGDRVSAWTVGRRNASLRMLNLLRSGRVRLAR